MDLAVSKVIIRNKASGGGDHMQPYYADPTLVGELYDYRSSRTSGSYVAASKTKVRNNIDWETLSIEEALTFLEGIMELPSVENFIWRTSSASLVGELYDYRSSRTSGSYVAASKTKVRNNIDWETLSIEEALTFLEGIMELPSVENFICILQKCRKKKNSAYSKHLYTHICNNGLDVHEVLENHFVPMFVECGSMSEAQQVFNRLAHRNEHSWTSLMLGYIDCGELRSALSLFKRMQEDCVQPSRYTFVALLKASTRLECMHSGQEIHAEIAKEGYERNLFVGSALVDMYAKCESLVEAWDVFEELPVRDVVSWNTLIGAYADCGFGEEALSCLGQMQVEGVTPDAITYICSLKACGSMRAIDKGRELHAKVDREGFQTNSFVGNTLVDMYAKCGSLVEAQKMFDKLSVRNEVSWNALITGYVEQGFDEEALDCLNQMRLEEGVSPDAVTLACGLRACIRLGATNSSQEIHSEIYKEGLERDPFVGNTLVDMYAKCGLLAEARQVFDNLSVQDVISWTSLIGGYVESELDEEALNYLEEMQLKGVSPNAVTLACILRACGNIGVLDKGQVIHVQITKGGFETDPSVGSMLIDMYAKCGSLAEGQEVFDSLPIRDIAAWISLIVGFSGNGLCEEALKFLAQMQALGVSPDEVTFSCCMKACGTIGAIDKGREIHAVIAKEGFEKGLFVCSSLVDMYVKCGFLAEAQELLEELSTRDIVLWNLLMAGYAEHGLHEETLIGLKRMQTEGVTPNGITFVCALKACGSSGHTDRGLELHAEVAKEGYEIDPYVGNTLVDMYAKNGLLAEALEVFGELVVRDIVSWTVLIAAYAEEGLGQEALDCLHQMQLEGMSPNVVTYVCCLKASASLGAIKRGRELHAAIAKVGFEGSTYISSALVDMYAKCGSLAETQVVFEELPVQDAVSWTALISGYAEYGLGKEALNFLQLMQLEGVPPSVLSWNYVILGFAEEGESEEAFRLYTQMQEQGLAPNVMTFVGILKACISSAALELGAKIHSQVHNFSGFEAEGVMETALVDMYSKCGRIVVAQQMFDAMPKKVLATWNALVTGYAQQGEHEQVFCLLEKMVEGGIEPDGITFLSVLTVCSHTGLLDKGQNYFETMITEYGIMPTIKHLNCMVDLCGRAGQLDKVVAMLDNMPVRPDVVTWSIVLGACRKWGNVEVGRRAFEYAVRLNKNDVTASRTMYNIYADAHMWEDAEKVKAIRPNLQAWKEQGNSWVIRGRMG